MAEGGYNFALPPSLGRGPVRIVSRRLADSLYPLGFTTVTPYHSYEQLEAALLCGEAHAAWGPPIVCARVEQAGGSVPLRAVRNGSVTYRSVILCRANEAIDFKQLGQPGGKRLRAAWVEQWSMGGYILPRHHLRASGVDLAQLFESETMYGSYKDCFDAVIDGRADLTASFAGRRGLGYVELCGHRATLLRQMAYTDESPNDGVVLASGIPVDQRERLELKLCELFTTRASLDLLAAMFDVNGFDEPPAGTYRALLELL